MAGLAHHPLIARLDDSQVCLVEAFCRYMKENIVTDLDLEYIRGFAMIAAASPDYLVHLGAALRIFGMPAADHFDTVSEELLHATNRPRAHKGRKRTYQRSVSVAPEDLPADWREALERNEGGGERRIDAPAPSIQTRLTQRLCMFAWSAQRAGRPIDLADEEALQAFYRDLEDRSAAKYTSGPREATLRNSSLYGRTGHRDLLPPFHLRAPLHRRRRSGSAEMAQDRRPVVRRRPRSCARPPGPLPHRTKCGGTSETSE